MPVRAYEVAGAAFGDPNLRTLVEAARDLMAATDLPSLLATLAREGRRLLGTALAFVGVPHAKERRMTVHAVDGFATDLDVGTSLLGRDVLGTSALENPGPQWISDGQRSPEIGLGGALGTLVRAEDLHGLIAVRLGHDGGRFGAHPFGILYLADRRVRTFTAHERALLASLADLAAAAIEKVRLLDLTVARLTGLRSTAARATADLSAIRALRSTHYDFIDLAVSGDGPQGLVDEAARRFNGAVVLYAADETVVAAGGATPGGARAGGVTAGQETAPRPEPPPPVTGRMPAMTDDNTWTVPVLAGDQRLGTLVVRSRGPLDAHDREMLPMIGQAAAVLVRQEGGVLGGHVRQKLLVDLLTAFPSGAGRLVQRARQLGLDLDRPHTVVTLRPAGAPASRATAWAAARADRVAGLAGGYDEDVVLLLPGTEDRAALARAVSADASAFLGCPVTAAAAGPATGPEEVARRYAEAVGCLRAMDRLNLAGHGASAEELGFLTVLLSGQEGVETFVDSVIGPVVDYDRRRPTDLVRTLEKYFAADANVSGAAESLHVHPNTVARRLERVKELLGAGWQRPSRALEIQLALRLARLLEKR